MAPHVKRPRWYDVKMALKDQRPALCSGRPMCSNDAACPRKITMYRAETRQGFEVFNFNGPIINFIATLVQCLGHEILSGCLFETQAWYTNESCEKFQLFVEVGFYR